MGVREWWNDFTGGAQTIVDLVTGNESMSTMVAGVGIQTGILNQDEATVVMQEGVSGAMEARNARNALVSRYGAPAQEFIDFIQNNPQVASALGRLNGGVTDGTLAQQIQRLNAYAEQNGGAQAFSDMMAVVAQRDASGAYQVRPGFMRFTALAAQTPDLIQHMGGPAAGANGLPDLANLRNLTADPGFYTDATRAIETHMSMARTHGAPYQFFTSAIGQNPALMALAGGVPAGGASHFSEAMQRIEQMAAGNPAMFANLNNILFQASAPGQEGAFAVNVGGQSYHVALRPGAEAFMERVMSNPGLQGMMAGGPGGAAPGPEAGQFLSFISAQVDRDPRFFEHVNQAMDRFGGAMPGADGAAPQMSLPDMQAMIAGAAADSRMRETYGAAYTDMVARLQGDGALGQTMTRLFGGGEGAGMAGQARTAIMLEQAVSRDPQLIGRLNTLMNDEGFQNFLGEIADNEQLAGLLRNIGGLDATAGDGNMPAAVINKLHELSTTRPGFFNDAARMLRDNKSLVSGLAGSVSGTMASDPVAALDRLAGFVEGNNMLTNVFNTLGGLFGQDFANGLRQFIQPFLSLLAPLMGQVSGVGALFGGNTPQMAGNGDMARQAANATGQDPAQVTVDSGNGPRPLSGPEPAAPPRPEDERALPRAFVTPSAAAPG